MPLRLTEEQQKSYKADPNYCPICDNKTLEASELVFSSRGNWAKCKINCTSCKSQWAETWTLSNITDLENTSNNQQAPQST